MDKDSIKTAIGHHFHATGEASKNRTLFTVNPGVPIVDALNSVSCLLSTLEDSIMDAAMGDQPLEHNAAWLTNHTLESAKAVVDSLIDCIENGERALEAEPPKWPRKSGLVTYYTLDDEHIQRAPFGKIGPFPTANAMRAALDRIERKFPDLTIISRKSGLAEELISDAELDEEYGKALEKLTAMGV